MRKDRIFDGDQVAYKARKKYEINLAYRAIAKLCKKTTGLFDEEKLSAAEEKIENYSIPVYTVRYEGNVIFRRYPTNLHLTTFRYECPILDKK